MKPQGDANAGASPGAGAGIDWQQPWLAPFLPFAALAKDSFSSGISQRSVAGVLNDGPDRPVQFVPQASLPAGVPYEQFIFDTGTVPTRDNLHDFFNGLCWLRFPHTKKRLNQLQAEEIRRNGVQPVRGPVRDALTLFDENAAFLVAPQPLWDALLRRDWQTLFVTQRSLWQEAQLVLFGHALLEKLVYPRKQATAHVYCGRPAINSIAELDQWIAGDVSADKLAGKPFTPLPVLGVPGWWPGNENFSFYDDSLVFRPPRLP